MNEWTNGTNVDGVYYIDSIVNSPLDQNDLSVECYSELNKRSYTNGITLITGVLTRKNTAINSCLN
jgi:hypothetical protein